MERQEFLRRIYENGIELVTGEQRRQLRIARECYLLASDFRDNPDLDRQNVSARIARKGIEALKKIEAGMSDNEGFNLLYGALSTMIEPARYPC